jgi:transcriptional regulator with XRE-family HTH domain
MNGDFPRILTLLRKEKGISQKDAAVGLGVSQALLSHYEKGIRECGLAFIVKCADYYAVSCDYLLGRSPERSGAVIAIEDIPEPDALGRENILKGSMLPILNKKLIANSLNILYDLLQKAGHKEFTTEISDYLMLSVYKMFRYIYSANNKNPDGLFSVDKSVFEEVSTAAMILNEMRVRCTACGIKTDGINPFEETEKLEITPEKIAANYPLFASSLSNLIKNVEATLGAVKK